MDISVNSLNSNTVNSKFQNLCQILIISCLKCMYNSNTVNLRFHYIEVILTVVLFEVSLIQSFNLNFFCNSNGSSHPHGGGGVCLSACWDTPPWCWPGDAPGVGLETPQVWAWWPPTRPVTKHAGIPPAMHAGISPPPVDKMTDRCKNITLP